MTQLIEENIKGQNIKGHISRDEGIRYLVPPNNHFLIQGKYRRLRQLVWRPCPKRRKSGKKK